MKLFRELTRVLGRQTRRCRLIFERRRLARLEAALGLLGWQQADYEGPAQDEVQRLNAFEREEARLTNESAQFGIEIAKLEEKRRWEERVLDEAVAAIFKEAATTEPSAEAVAALLEAKRKERREIEARLPVIDREKKEAEEKYRSLIGPGEPVPEVRAQILRWQKLLVSLPREREQWQEKSREIGLEAEELQGLLTRAGDLRAQFDEADKEMLEQIAERRQSKRKVEKQIEALEKAKANPYREIGRTLADHRIAPLNQPEALTAVLVQREKIAVFEAEIAASLEQSARDGRVGGGGPGVFLMWAMIATEAIALLAFAAY